MTKHSDKALSHHPLHTVRLYLYTLMFPGHHKSKLASLVSDFIIVMIVLSSLSIVLEHIDFIATTFHRELVIFDEFSLVVFTAEYVLRLITGGLQPSLINKRFSTLRYAVTPMALLDLVVILPFFISFGGLIDLRFLRLVRLLRLAKLVRFIGPIWTDFVGLNKGRTFRQHVYSTMNPDVHSGQLHAVFDIFMGGVIFLSVVAVMLESVADVHDVLAREFHIFDMITVGIFSVEYLFRVYCCVENPDYEEPVVGRLRYMVSPAALVDLIAILPFYMTFLIQIDLRFLRVIRLLRLLKFTRYSSAMSTLSEVFEEQMPSLSAALFITLVVTIFSASIVYLVEHEAQPEKFTSIPEATYWAMITLLSVGYGDIYPVTPLGQFMTMIISLVGLGLVALPTGILASGFSEKMRERAATFKTLVDAKVADGNLSEKEKVELKIKAHQLGLGRLQEKDMEQAEVDAFKRAEAEMATIRSDRATQTTTVTEIPLDLATIDTAHAAMPLSDFEKLLDQIGQLSVHEKSRIMARLASDMEQTLTPKK
ncbi:MAG: ion transporter [Beijerinckiaceae bacterium]